MFEQLIRTHFRRGCDVAVINLVNNLTDKTVNLIQVSDEFREEIHDILDKCLGESLLGIETKLKIQESLNHPKVAQNHE